MKRILLAASLALFLALAPLSAFAQASAGVPQAGGVPVDVPQAGGVASDPTDCGSTLCNPLKGVDSIGGLIFKVINFVYSLSYAVIALFLIISGFKFVTAQGSEDKITDAKNTFKYTIIGAILLIGANVITQVIKNLIDSFR